MEVFCTQDVISCALALGYDLVDCIFVTMVIGKASLEEDFIFEDKELSNKFQELVDFDGFVYRLKKGISLDTNISPDKNNLWTVRQAFSTKKQLLEYIRNIDLQKIVDKKIKIVGVDRLNDYLLIFSNKEKEFLPRRKKKESTQIKVPKM